MTCSYANVLAAGFSYCHLLVHSLMFILWWGCPILSCPIPPSPAAVAPGGHAEAEIKLAWQRVWGSDMTWSVRGGESSRLWRRLWRKPRQKETTEQVDDFCQPPVQPTLSLFESTGGREVWLLQTEFFICHYTLWLDSDSTRPGVKSDVERRKKRDVIHYKHVHYVHLTSMMQW